jgi:allantoinase
MKPSAYGPFDYQPIDQRPHFEWPGGARLALWVIPNIEFFSLQDTIPAGSGGTGTPAPDVPLWSARDYGNRVGVFRLMKVLDRYGIRATVALNSSLCAQHPQIIAEGCARQWEWMGHNETNTRRLNEVGPEEEARIIRDALGTIEKATGTRPAGWLSSGLQETWHTLDHLAAEGCTYVCDWTNEGGRSLVSVPYSHEINDKPAYEKAHRTAEAFGAMICRQFDVLYEEGARSPRVMAIALHPYLSGVPHRIPALDAALAYICRHEGVWRATGAEIAKAYLAACPSPGAA